MKTKLLLVLLALFAVSPDSLCQFSFGVSPGIGFNSVHFGYRFKDKFVSYIGFQYLHGKFTAEESGEEFDSDLSQVVSYTDKMEMSGSLYLPAIGAKYFIKQHNKLNAYVGLALTKPFISGKVKFGTEEEDFYREMVESLNKRMWGGELGFGIEYFVDENFSFGGEFGFRILHIGYSESHEDEFFNPNTGSDQSTLITNEIKLNGSPTYSKISFNYYF